MEEENHISVFKELQEEKMPTNWHCKKHEEIILDIYDVQNYRKEIAGGLLKDANKMDDEGKQRNIEVKHNLVNFLNVHLGHKLELYLHQGETKRLTFDNLELAKMLHSSGSDAHHIYEHDAVQEIINAQFEQTRRFFFYTFLTYVILYAIPLLSSFLLGDLL